MKIIYASNPWSISSWFIRAFTFSKWSHVAIQLDEYSIFDATFRHGVRISSYKEFCEEYPKQELVTVKVPNEPAALVFLQEQLGKKYDWTAIFGIVLQRNWQEADRWFCSEVVEAIILAGGLKRFRDKVNRITPQQSWAVQSEE